MLLAHLLVPLLALTSALPALAQPQPGAAPRTINVDAMDKFSGTVEAIDKAQRRLTVKGPKGHSATLAVDPAVRNFDQIKVGDRVAVRYLAALSLTLTKDGKALPGVTSTTAGARAAAGERTAAATSQRLEITAEVTAVDAANQRVTLRGPKQTVDIQVTDPAQFRSIKVGDQVQAVYSEAVALSVEPAAGTQ